MRIYICSKGCTWDVPAFDLFGDEFACDEIREKNAYLYYDTVVFEGGELLQISDDLAEVAVTIAPPWSEGDAIIIPPWG